MLTVLAPPGKNPIFTLLSSTYFFLMNFAHVLYRFQSYLPLWEVKKELESIPEAFTEPCFEGRLQWSPTLGLEDPTFG